ncbi:MAG: PAS domain S-box protein, partial [Ktedonobacterales bacterium]
MSPDQGDFGHIDYSEAMEHVESQESVDSRTHADNMVREQRQARHVADVAEARLRAAVEMVPEAIVMIDPIGHIMLVNHQTEALFGYTRDQLLGRPVELLMPERYHAIHLVHRAEYASDPHVRPMGLHQELVGRRADGTEFPVEINLGPISMDGISHTLATCRDTTERRQLEQSLREHMERLARTFEAMDEGVYIYDRAGQLLQMNEAARALVGYDEQQPDRAPQLTRDRLRQYQIRDVEGHPLPPEAWPVGRILQDETITTAAPVELRISTLTGREQIASVTGAPLRDASGEVVGAVLVTRDVTEQRRLEQELMERANEIESIFEADADGVTFFDPEGRTVRMNSAQLRLLGYDVADTVDTLLPELRSGWFVISDANGETLPREAWPIYRVLRGETFTGPQAVEMRLRTLNGREIQVSVSGAPVVNGEGRIIGGVTSTRDVTAERQLEQQRTDILRVVAHDLASPVAAIKMFLQLQQRSLDRGQPRPPNSELLATLTQSVGRMQRLLDDLRVVVGQEGHQLSLDRRPTDLVALCQQEAQSIAMATERDVRLELPDGPAMADVDRDRIGQVLANLLSNANKYSPLDRPITLTLRVEPAKLTELSKRAKRERSAKHARHARVLVQDKGPGIPPQELPQLWERFHRVAGVQARPG